MPSISEIHRRLRSLVSEVPITRLPFPGDRLACFSSAPRWTQRWSLCARLCYSAARGAALTLTRPGRCGWVLTEDARIRVPSWGGHTTPTLQTEPGTCLPVHFTRCQVVCHHHTWFTRPHGPHNRRSPDWMVIAVLKQGPSH